MLLRMSVNQTRCAFLVVSIFILLCLVIIFLKSNEKSDRNEFDAARTLDLKKMENNEIIQQVYEDQKLDLRKPEVDIVQTGDSVARDIQKKVRIVCWVNTFWRYLTSRATAVRDTWGRRCDKLLFVSDKTNDSFPTIGFDTPHGRHNMVVRIFKAFDYMYEHHLNDGDWFMRSDDDAYVIMENLKYLLTSYNSSEKWYLGRSYSFGTPQGFNSGGAGFVLSKAALETLYNRPKDLCQNDKNEGSDDFQLGICMFKLGVKIGDTRDKFNKSRFHPYRPNEHAVKDTYCLRKGENILRYNCPKGMSSFSPYLISFHHIRPEEMYTFEIMLYHTRLYGVSHTSRDVNIHDDIETDKTVQDHELSIVPAAGWG